MAEHTTEQHPEGPSKVKANLVDAWEMWEAMSEPERLTVILDNYPAGAWYDNEAGKGQNLSTLAHFRKDACWGAIKQRFKDIGGNPFDLQQSVDVLLATQRNGRTNAASHAEETRFPFVDLHPHMPALPARASCKSPHLQTWLRTYEEHSKKWAPRAAPGYHTAVGLWVLSTVAARRIVIHTGSHDVFPTLFLALIGESTLWTKSTTASIGLRIIRRANCGHLLSPDRTTPQFLLKLMSGIVPHDYGQKPPEEQEAMRKAFGFSAQRGWFYEEWGGMLHQMRRIDSPHAELNKLLIVLEGGATSFETGTIQRGLERIEFPYLALLGNATPHDLLPFMGEGDSWWHTGFWPRFACISAPAGQKPVRTPRPREEYTIPEKLLFGLSDWNKRLGTPHVDIHEVVEDTGKRTGRWAGTITNKPEHVMSLDDEVYDAMEAYDDALLEVSHGPHVHTDLAPWYARAKEKALRVAMLLASVDGDDIITLPFWQEAQTIVEGWRQNLHDLVGEISADGQQSRQGMRRSRLEKKIESMLAKSGGMTARELQRHLSGVTSEELHHTLDSMVKIGTIYHEDAGKKRMYLIFEEEEESSPQRSVDDVDGVEVSGDV
jgi:hypothetical protein